MRTSSDPTPRHTLVTLIVLVTLARAACSHAAATPEQQCQKARHDAAGKYAQCQQKEMGKYFAGGDPAKLEAGLSKCRVKYTETWPKLQQKAQGTGSTCDASRFTVNGNDTVTDRLTGLQWDLNANSNFNWHNASATFVNLNNGGSCVGGFCDWRLPTRAELQTLLLQPHPCSASPCIDGAFGGGTGTAASFYWTDTIDVLDNSLAWVVHFGTGQVGNASRTDVWKVRAVRGGL